MAKYKINEAAHVLGVDRVILYDKLISYSKELKPYVSKVSGITYIEEDGLNVMKTLLTNGHEQHEVGQPKWRFNHDDIAHRVQMFKPSSQEPVEHSKKTDAGICNRRDEVIASDFDYKQKNHEIELLKSEIVKKRNELIQLDGDIKRRSDAINSYHALMTEDLEWLWSMEEKIVNHLEKIENEAEKEASKDSIFNFIGR